MDGSELIVALFALVFLAFCLTAIAVIAMSKDKDEVADKSVSALRQLKSEYLRPKTRLEEADKQNEDEDEEGEPPI
ncbi:MAG TPA: hypothetical protein PLD25_02090 [Chloroflexota bacterium]|nr:hypothetical protein [Chloroflexota bacterium]HUM67395.1 hypothetical protein [Chloroflexota bacterium]